MMASKSILSLFAAITAVAAQKCPIQFDGRIPNDITPNNLTVFDTTNPWFNPSYVFGQNLKWSTILTFPTLNEPPAEAPLPPSLFDNPSSSTNYTRALEVHITDASIFASSSSDIQTGFRRAELLPASNSGSDPSTLGVKTLHFSLRKDILQPLNYSHEYQLVFLETEDYSTNQFALKTGTISGQPAGQNSNLLVLQSNVNNPTNLFTQDFTANYWHNFAITLDFDENTTQVYYSNESSPLVAVTGKVSNDVSGRGEFHFGVLKKPTGTGLTDITRQGYQESGIHEGIIFGGIFEEDSSGGCVSLSL